MLPRPFELKNPKLNHEDRRVRSVRVIRQNDPKAVQLDLFNSMKGRPPKLAGVEER